MDSVECIKCLEVILLLKGDQQHNGFSLKDILKHTSSNPLKKLCPSNELCKKLLHLT